MAADRPGTCRLGPTGSPGSVQRRGSLPPRGGEDPEGSPTTYGLVTNEHGVAVALLVSPGLGDGSYPVEARFEDVGGTMRIAEIRVRFLPHPVLGYGLPGGEA